MWGEKRRVGRRIVVNIFNRKKNTEYKILKEQTPEDSKNP